MGVVFRARHRPTGAIRALKVLGSVPGPEGLERFRREAQALARLAGHGVVTVHETGEDGRRFYFAMELMTGGSLRERLARGRLSWLEASRIVAALARTAARAHELGLVHRDLKPENVLFDESDQPRLADWGCVRDLGRSALTGTGVSLGTLAYMAPEQLEAEPVGPPADVWALGVVLAESVAGARPFQGGPVQLLEAARAGWRSGPAAPAAKLAVARVLDGALAPEARKRLSAQELAVALETLLTTGAPERGGGSLRAVAKRLRIALLGIAVLGIAVVALIVGGAGGFARTTPGTPAPLEPTPAVTPAPRGSPASGPAKRERTDPAAYAQAVAKARAAVDALLDEVNGVLKTPDKRVASMTAARTRTALSELRDPELALELRRLAEPLWVHAEGAEFDFGGARARAREGLVAATETLPDPERILTGSLHFENGIGPDPRRIEASLREAEAVAAIDSLRGAALVGDAVNGDEERIGRRSEVPGDLERELHARLEPALACVRLELGSERRKTFAKRIGYVLCDRGGGFVLALNRSSELADAERARNFEEVLALRLEALACCQDDRRARDLQELARVRFVALHKRGFDAARKTELVKVLRASEEALGVFGEVVESALLRFEGHRERALEIATTLSGSRDREVGNQATALRISLLLESSDRGERLQAKPLLAELKSHLSDSSDREFVTGLTLAHLEREVARVAH